jgi:hypothetical protein
MISSGRLCRRLGQIHHRQVTGARGEAASVLSLAAPAISTPRPDPIKATSVA